MGRKRQIFDHFFITQRAVEDGLGIGIGPLPLLQVDVDLGRLMTPFPRIRVQRTGYVALVALDTDQTGPVASFVAWLAAAQS